MRITFCSQKRYEKNFKPMTIRPCKDFSSNSQVYNILNDQNVYIGQFSYSKNAHNSALISDLDFATNLRGTKDSANALISMKNFVLEKAKKENLDYIYCYAHKDNIYNVSKLYKKLVPEFFCQDLHFNVLKFMLPLTRNGKDIIEEELLFLKPKETAITNIEEVIKSIIKF